jgi:hypothetical protein
MFAVCLASLIGSSKELAMNGTSGFREALSSVSRLQANRLLNEQRHQFENGFWHHFMQTILTYVGSIKQVV